MTGATTINVSAMQPNLGPAAIASASPGSGYAPLSVTLNGANSYDTDGTIVSYQWNFGDPASQNENYSSLSNPIHIDHELLIQTKLPKLRH